MTENQRTLHRILFAASLLVCMTGLAVHAQGNYPPQLDRYVNDFALLLPEQDASDIDLLLRAFEENTGIEMTTMVIQSMSGIGAGDASTESFAARLSR